MMFFKWIDGAFPWVDRVLILSAACAASYILGEFSGRDSERAKQAQAANKQLLQVIGTQQQQATVTHQVEAKAAQQAEQIRTVYRNINKEVIRYVSTPDRNVCRLDNGWLRIHDSAATGVPSLPDATRELDAAASAATADDALRAVTENYGIASENAARLTALQAWVNAQAGVR